MAPFGAWDRRGGLRSEWASSCAAGVRAGRRPRHPVGWLLLGLGLSLSVRGVTSVYVRYGLVARPRTLPAAGYLAGSGDRVAER
jgi:hypothetical protein